MRNFSFLCCNLLIRVALNARTGCARRTNPKCICVANKKLGWSRAVVSIVAKCHAWRTCRSGFPIATYLLQKKLILLFGWLICLKDSKNFARFAIVIPCSARASVLCDACLEWYHFNCVLKWIVLLGFAPSVTKTYMLRKRWSRFTWSFF